MNTFARNCFIAVLIPWFHNVNAQTNSVSAKDFLVISGCWQGTLTYLDYKSGKPYSMPANLDVKQAGNLFLFENKYPNEPSANAGDTIMLSGDGHLLNNEQVLSNTVLDSGKREIITEATGTDGNDNRKARFRYTYFLGKNEFSRKKEIMFNGDSTWIRRHEYRYNRCR